MTRDERVALAQRVKAELERELPHMAALREQLVAAGMMAPGFSAIVRLKTPNLTYSKLDDDPDYFARQHAKPPHLTPEIEHAIQARQDRPSGPTNPVLNSRGSYRRR
jgi:hypothetical protein